MKKIVAAHNHSSYLYEKTVVAHKHSSYLYEKNSSCP